MRDHEPITIEDFNGLWRRGDRDSTPADHFPDCNNIQYIHSGFKTRDGLELFQAYPVVLRAYNYVQPGTLTSGGGITPGDSLLVLDDGGNIYHTKSPTPFAPILTIVGMTDFGFVSYAGRAYITPCDGVTGLLNEHIYVYKGDGTPARKAGGTAPVGTLVVADGAAGSIEAGVHIFGVVYETDTGFLTSIAGFVSLTAAGAKKADISAIPVSAESFVVARRIVATKFIAAADFTGDLKGYEFFFVPSGRIGDNVATTLTVDFFDADLISSADHLFDLYTNIPAGVGLATYHSRLVSFAENANISIARVSVAGEPEAVSQVDGLINVPLDGNPLTNAQEFRDILYLFKSTRTLGYPDNGDVPSSWEGTVLDQGIGASLHGIATVLDSGGVNIDYLIITNFSGVMLFNGAFNRPDGELSWKIKDLWDAIERSLFNKIQILNETISQVVFMTLPDGTMEIANYANGMDPKKIRWAPWSFDVNVTTIALIESNKLIVGSSKLLGA